VADEFTGNYEDNPNVFAPGELVSEETLDRLRFVPPEVAERLKESSLTSDESPSYTALEALRTRAELDCSPEGGAPPEAFEVEVDAMTWGYRFGVDLLGGATGRCSLTADELRSGADALDLYALAALPGEQPLGTPSRWHRLLTEVLFRRHPVENPYAMEEACYWAWAFGLGVAVVEADCAST
jgi:hypothetical protein